LILLPQIHKGTLCGLSDDRLMRIPYSVTGQHFNDIARLDELLIPRHTPGFKPQQDITLL